MKGTIQSAILGAIGAVLVVSLGILLEWPFLVVWLESLVVGCFVGWLTATFDFFKR